MTPTTQTPPSIADLMLRFVNRPVDAASIQAEAGALGEVEPHEVAVGFRTDPRLAWNEGLAVLAALGARESIKLNAPSDWAAVVVRHESAASQPFALASYPQRVRDLSMLLQVKDLSKLLPGGESRPASSTLLAWSAKQTEPAAKLMAAAILRAAGDLDQATVIVNEVRNLVPESLKAVFTNEEATLLWLKGDSTKAVSLWESLPETAATLFNRGMAALFLGDAVKARGLLKKAASSLSETDGWHHLGSLYLALAEMR